MAVVTYRRANLDDIDQLVILRVLMQCEVNDIDPFLDFSDYRKKMKQYLLDNLENQTYISGIAVLNDKIISASGVVFYQKPPSIVSSKGLVGYVTNVFTLPDFRRQGHAFKTLEILVSAAEKLKADKLHLGSTEDGKALYEKIGFRKPRFANLELKIKG